MLRTMVALCLSALSCAAMAASIDKQEIIRPAGTHPYQGDRSALVALGEKLWNDPRLSNTGKTACASCHKGNTRMFKKTFLGPYPHYVKMADKKADLQEITTEGMVQFCMLVPMKSHTFPWDSKELAALTAYTEDVVQPAYEAKKGQK